MALLLGVGIAVSPGFVRAAEGLPVVTIHPAGQTVRFASATSFRAEASGAGLLGYRWQLNGTNLVDTYNRYTGTTAAELQIAPVHADELGAYSVVVTNGSGVVTSQVAVLQMAVQPGLQMRHEGATDPVSEGWRYLGGGNSAVTGPTNDQGTAAWRISDPSGELNHLSVQGAFPSTNLVALALAHGWSLRARLRMVAGNPDGLPTIMLGFNTGDWYHRLDFNTDAAGNVTVDALGGGHVTVPGGDYHTYDLRQEPGAIPQLYVDGRLELAACPGAALIYPPRLFFGAGSSAGIGAAHFARVEVEFFGPLQLLQPPEGRAGVVGDDLVLHVEAYSRWPLSYQWFKGGVPLADGPGVAGATGPQLSLEDVGIEAAGSYQARVGDGQGSLDSPQATVVVHASAASRLQIIGGPAGPSGVAVDAAAGLRYAVLASGDLAGWQPIHTNRAPFEFTLPGTLDSPQRYYRALYLP